MPLIKCPECGKEISDLANSCPNCGFPIGFESQSIHVNSQNNPNINNQPQYQAAPTQYQMPEAQYQQPNKPKKENKNILWDILAALALFITPFIPIGIIIMWAKKVPKSTFVRTLVTVFFALIFIIWLSIIGNNSDNTPEKVSSTTPVIVNEDNKSEEASRNTAKITAITTINEDIIYNDNGIIITVQGCEEDSGAINISFLIENNSNLNLGFNARAYSVNQIMTGNNIYDMDCDVAAGKKANTVLKIKKDFLTKYNIETVKSFDILFWAYDNDKSFKEFDTGQIIIHTNNYDDNIGNIISGVTVYDDNDIKIDYLSGSNNEFTYCITNNTGNYFDFDVENITINDFTSSDWNFDLMGIIVLDSCQSVFTVKAKSEFLDLNKITDIDKVEFTLNIRPLEDYFSDWSTDLIETQIKQ